MGAVDPFKGPPPPWMAHLENLKFNPNAVNIYLPKIISYLSLA